MMPTRWKRYSRRSSTGLTLLEAAAATALLGTLLTGIVMARGSLMRQSHAADLRRQACRMADGLLSEWWLEPDTFPRNAHGRVADEPGWTWRTSAIALPAGSDLAGLGGEMVVLDIIPPAPAEQTPACRIEIVLPIAKEDE